MDLVAVLDASGSMMGAKMAALQATMHVLIDALDGGDRLGIVAYNSWVQVLLPLRRMTQKVKARAHRLVRSIRTTGCTNMSAGLQAAMRMIEDAVHFTGASPIRSSREADNEEEYEEEVEDEEEEDEEIGLLRPMDGRRLDWRFQTLRGPTLRHTATGVPTPALQTRGRPRMHSTSAASAVSPQILPQQEPRSQHHHLQHQQQQQQQQRVAYGRMHSAPPVRWPRTSPASTAAHNRRFAANVKSILLLSDGQANEGVVQPHQLAALLSVHRRKCLVKYSVNCFGYGTDADTTMLRAVAESGDGLYYFIERDVEVAEAFASCLGGLVSTVAHQLRLELEVRSPGTRFSRSRFFLLSSCISCHPRPMDV